MKKAAACLKSRSYWDAFCSTCQAGPLILSPNVVPKFQMLQTTETMPCRFYLHVMIEVAKPFLGWSKLKAS